MAKLNKVCNSNFDVERGVILYSKGTFNSEVIDKSSHPYVASLNTSALLYEDKIDFLFLNDIETIDNVKNAGGNFNNIDNIICPINPHVKSGREKSNYTYNNILNTLSQVNTTVYTYRLHTQEKEFYIDLNKQDNYRFGRINSVYHTALYWLLLVGFKQFAIYGVSSRGDYQENFIKNQDCGTKRSKAWYTKNYKRGIDIFTNASYFSIKPITYDIYST
tara:strand:- start:71 stop:727 length:657 start_codon:yes stop_codon:yes gene_type:complete